MPPNTLSTLRSLSDLGVFFSEFGYTPCDVPFDDTAQVVARWRGFKVIAILADDSASVARALARKIGRAGERGIAAALGAGALAIAAPRPGLASATKVLLLSLNDPGPAQLEQLERLRPQPRSNALAHSLRVAEALSTEAAGERFFARFRVVASQMADSLDGRHSNEDRTTVALLALTRILFLYFVQAKGWLNDEREFLRRRLDDALYRRRDFHRSVLDPLFFGTLNRPPNRRRQTGDFGSIPYLNGGLFDRHPLERTAKRSHFGNDLWRDAFDTLFERFRFCVREADEVDAIAPDMLGRVFERLMAGSERLKTGTFYTPETVVRQVADTAIATLLVGRARVGADVIERLLHAGGVSTQEAERLRGPIKSLRVLDPATGSGAFLLGVLESLTELRVAVHCHRGRVARSQLRRDVLARNLFGVDINPIAVRLAELRLWLAVIADDPTTRIEAVTPLPNLDTIVRQGDTLLDPIGAGKTATDSPERSTSRTAAQIHRLRSRLFHLRGRDHARTIRDLRTAETRLAGSMLAGTAARSDHAIQEMEALRDSRDLFGRKRGLDAGSEQDHPRGDAPIREGAEDPFPRIRSR